jgi:hypothetical protein
MSSVEAKAREIGAMLPTLVKITVELIEAHKNLPELGSTASRDRSVQSNFALETAWGKNPVDQVYGSAGMLIQTAGEFLQGVHRVTAAGVFGLSAIALSRNAVEAEARAAWLLDPKISVKARIGRGMTERWESIRRQLEIVEDPAFQARGRQRISELVAGGKRFGIPPALNKKGKLVGIGERRPFATDLVAKLLEDGDDPGFGKLMYGAYSAVSHSTLYALGQAMELRPDPEGLTGTAGKLGSPNWLPAMMGGAILGYERVIRVLTDLYGWSRRDWSPVAYEILKRGRKLAEAD